MKNHGLADTMYTSSSSTYSETYKLVVFYKPWAPFFSGEIFYTQGYLNFDFGARFFETV